MTQIRPARSIENCNLPHGGELHGASEGGAGDAAIPIGFDKYISGVCHSDLLSGNRHVTQGDHVRANPALTPGMARAFSFIRTLTVGSGISPDLLDPSFKDDFQRRLSKKALAGSQREAAYR